MPQKTVFPSLSYFDSTLVPPKLQLEPESSKGKIDFYVISYIFYDISTVCCLLVQCGKFTRWNPSLEDTNRGKEGLLEKQQSLNWIKLLNPCVFYIILNERKKESSPPPFWHRILHPTQTHTFVKEIFVFIQKHVVLHPNFNEI